MSVSKFCVRVDRSLVELFERAYAEARRDALLFLALLKMCQLRFHLATLCARLRIVLKIGAGGSFVSVDDRLALFERPVSVGSV